MYSLQLRYYWCMKDPLNICTICIWSISLSSWSSSRKVCFSKVVSWIKNINCSWLVNMVFLWASMRWCMSFAILPTIVADWIHSVHFCCIGTNFLWTPYILIQILELTNKFKVTMSKKAWNASRTMLYKSSIFFLFQVNVNEGILSIL